MLYLTATVFATEEEPLVEISTAAVIILFITIVFFYLLYTSGKKKYMDYVEALDKKDFTIRDFMPAGFMVMELIKYKYNSALDRKARKYLKELYEPEYTEFYLRVYWAKAITYSLIAVCMGALVNVAMNDPLIAVFIAIGLGALLPYFVLQEIEDKVKKRHIAIMMDMPELTNKIVILTGAGQTLQGALFKIASELSSEKIVYQELARTMAMIDAGESADSAFDQMCVKCNMPEMRRFVAIILQNIHRGGSDVSAALKGIGEELWAARKATALRIAEEASTKMLFPMMLMLLAVVLLVIAPAVQGMNL